MSDEEKTKQLELELKVLRANNKGLKDKIDEQFKEIKALKLIHESYKEMIEENKKYIIKMTDEQYSKVIGLVELDTNKKWEDKIKAKIKELEKLNDESTGIGYWFAIYYLQLLLEKE